MSVTSPPQLGEDFGGYRIDALLGRGGMGVVYRAWQRRMNRAVALKVLPADLAQDATYRARFAREAAALAQLDSPHVVQIFDHGEQDGSLYLAMQLIQGTDLGRVLDSGVVAPRRALRIVAQVAGALGDGHAVGVVHRDVKPSNVLLRTRAPHDDADAEDADFAYLCDFGIARSAADVVAPETAGIIGTLAYLAPERLRGEQARPASDVYSLGCMLWALLTGSPPFRGSQPEVIIGHVQGSIPQLVGDDRRTAMLNSLLAGMLAKDPTRRPSVAAVRRRIREILAIAGPGPRDARGTRGSAEVDADVPMHSDGHTAAQATVTTPTTVIAGPPLDRPPPAGGHAPPQKTLPEPRRPRRRLLLAGAAIAALALVGVVVAVLLLDPVRTAHDRLTRATPAGAVCVEAAVPADAADVGALAQVVCDVGADVGELRVVALRGQADGYLREVVGQEQGALQRGDCPADLPAVTRWESGARSGTLLCFVLGSSTRYAWTVDDLDAVAVLDGRADVPFPQDLAAVAAYFASVRYS